MEEKLTNSSLNMKYIFGCTSDHHSLSIYDKNVIFYKAGNNVVRQKISEGTQTFIAGSENCHGISALCLSNSRLLLAIAESGTRPIIYLYDPVSLRKKKFLALVEYESEQIEYIAMKFKRNDDTYLFAVARGFQKTLLLVWNISTSIMVSSFDLDLTQDLEYIEFSYINSSNFVLAGKTWVRVYKFENNKISLVTDILENPKLAKIGGGLSSLSILRLTDDIFFKTETNSIIIFDFQGNLKRIFKSLFEISFMIGVNEGIMTVGESMMLCKYIIYPEYSNSNANKIKLLAHRAELNSENDKLKQNVNLNSRALSVFQNLFEGIEDEEDPEEQKNNNNSEKDENESELSEFNPVDIEIETFGLKAPKDFKDGSLLAWQTNSELELTLVLTGGKQMYMLNMKNQEEMFWIPIIESPHLYSITSVDVASRKPFVVTCGSDKTLKIWNYETHKLEIDWILTEEPLSVAIHPSGFFLAIGYSDNLTILTIYHDFLGSKRKILKEIQIKNVREIRFSNGGDKLAVASGVPQIISVYSFYSMELFQHLVFKGHTGRVTSLTFSDDDTSIFSSATDGIVYQWNLTESKRIEVVNKGPSLSHIVVKKDLATLYLVTHEEKSLTEFNEKYNRRKYEIGVQLSQLALTKNNKNLFGGCAGIGSNNSTNNHEGGKSNNQMSMSHYNRNTSCVMGEAKKQDILTLKAHSHMGVIKYFKNLTNFQIVETIQAHDEKGVSKLILTTSDKYLISVGNDGLVCLFEVRDTESKTISENFKFCEEILATKIEIDELRQRKEVLTISLQENQFQNSNAIDLNDLDDKMRYLKEQLMLREKNEQEIVEEQIQKRNQKFQEKKEEMTRTKFEFEEEISEIEHMNNKELAKETRRIEKLKAKQKNLEKEQNELLKELEVSMKKEEDMLSNQFEGRLSEKNAEMQKLMNVL